MLELGWSEIFVIVAITVLVVGPKELPVVMRNIGYIVRRLTYIKYAFSRQFEDFLRETDLDELRRAVNFEQKDFNEEGEDDEYYKEDFVKPVHEVSGLTADVKDGESADAKPV